MLIVERLIADDPAAALPVLLSDLNMLVITGGLERTNAEYGELLTGGGPETWPGAARCRSLRDHRGARRLSRPEWA